MRRVSLLLVLFVAGSGCVHRTVAVEPAPVEPDVSAWVDQLGSILTPARACVAKHPGPGATIVGVRTLATGETSILTRTKTAGVIACVHDGRSVVYQARVELSDDEVNRLSFVMLEGGTPLADGVCLRVREVHWGSRFVGWVAEPKCARREANHGPQ